MSRVRRFSPEAGGGFRWHDVDTLRYKDDASAPFRDVTRQVLFSQPDQACELRYFEVAANGHSTLERHQHTHAVLILRGHGTVQLGETVEPIAENDLVTIEPMTWHQFAAAADSPLGFLCLVSKDRDRPQLPTDEQVPLPQRQRPAPERG